MNHLPLVLQNNFNLNSINSNIENPPSQITPEAKNLIIENRENVVTKNIKSATFGSNEILNNCWSIEEIRGHQDDNKIIIVKKLHENIIPKRTLPKNILPPLDIKYQNSIRHISPIDNKRVISLTFDLCEKENEITGYDNSIINYLREHKIKATFYAGGKWMRSHPEKTMQLMADPLFEIGNHGWSHENLRLLTAKEMVEQIFWTQTQYELLWEELSLRPGAQAAGAEEMNKIPKVPLTFRFPYGRCNKEALQILAANGLPAIQWNVVTGDAYRKQTAEKITDIIMKNTRPGSIIIFHANGRGHGTAKALSVIVPSLINLGYEFVTISELLNYGPVFSSEDCYENKPGDNDRYDNLK